MLFKKLGYSNEREWTPEERSAQGRMPGVQTEASVLFRYSKLRLALPAETGARGVEESTSLCTELSQEVVECELY